MSGDDFDGVAYDRWKTSEPVDVPQDEQDERDYDAENDAAREDALAAKNDPHYWD